MHLGVHVCMLEGLDACLHRLLCRKIKCVHDVQIYGYETDDRLTTGRWTDEVIIRFVGGVSRGMASLMTMHPFRKCERPSDR